MVTEMPLPAIDTQVTAIDINPGTLPSGPCPLHHNLVQISEDCGG